MNNKSPCHYLQAGGPNRKWVPFTLEALPVPAGVQDEGNSVWTEGERHLLWPRWEAFPEDQTSAKCPSPAVVKQYGGKVHVWLAPAPPLHTDPISLPRASTNKPEESILAFIAAFFTSLREKQTFQSIWWYRSITKLKCCFFYAESYSNSTPNSYPHYQDVFPSARVCQHWASFLRCLPSFP